MLKYPHRQIVCRGGGTVDTSDLKSGSSNGVRVRFSLAAPESF